MAKDKALTLLNLALALDPEGTSEIMNLMKPSTCAGVNCDLSHHCVLHLAWSGIEEELDMEGQPQLDHPVGNIPEDCKHYVDAYPEDPEE